MPASLDTIYSLLRQHFGLMPEWWPIAGDDAPFEMLLGAVLVQQTRWEAVEQTIQRLQAAQMLTPQVLAHADAEHLAHVLRAVAFYRQKAAGLIAISAYLCAHYAGDMAALLDQPTAPLRSELLALPRIGPETADVLLLYAGQHPVFVIDDYTRRVLERVQPTASTASTLAAGWRRARYTAVQQHIEHELAAALPDEAADLRQLYADYHALINEVCVRYCLARRPRCEGPPARRVYSQQEGRPAYLERHDGCPLRAICAYYQQTPQQKGS
jgi:endonuclease-3 related protein